EVAREPVPVMVSEFEVIMRDHEWLRQNDDGSNDLAVRVVCSAGTYVRALAESVGERLGVGAHLAELRRTRAGEFRIADANTLNRLKELAESELMVEAVISPDNALSILPAIQLDHDDGRRVLHGIDIQVDFNWVSKQAVRLRDSAGELIAVG